MGKGGPRVTIRPDRVRSCARLPGIERATVEDPGQRLVFVDTGQE